MKVQLVKTLTLIAAVAGLFFSASQSIAQDSEGATLEEVFVTAQKREQSLQDIPASVTAITTAQLNNAQVINVMQLEQLAPNVSIGVPFGTAQIFIRGVGLGSSFSGIDPSVALHIDGAVVSPGMAQLGVFYDVERLEVLRGPQGSLYGRNATGGSINVITKKPTEETEGYINATFGNYNLMTVEAAISGTIIKDKLLGRIAVKTNKRDGYGEDEAVGIDINDADQESTRIHLEWRPTDNLNLLFTASKEEENDANYSLNFIGADGSNNPATNPAIANISTQTAKDPYNTRGTYPSADNTRDNEAYSLAVTWDINDNYQLKSLSNTREFYASKVQDLDASEAMGLIVRNDRFIENTSHELQLNYNNGDDLNVLVGYYYYEEELLADSPLGFDPAGLFGPGDDIVRVTGLMDVDAWAVFGTLDYDINESWSVSLGARYSDEERTKVDAFKVPGAIIPFADEIDGSDTTVDIAVEYRPNDDVNLYAKYSQGFKSGAASLGQISAFTDPETVDSFEIGMKGFFLDQSLSVAAAAFYYDFKDMQLGATKPAPGGAFGSKLENAGEAEITGIELELTYLASANLRIDAQFGYLDSDLVEFMSVNEIDPASGYQDWSGNELMQAPELNGSIRAEYTADLNNGGTLQLGGGVYYRDEIFFSVYNLSNMQEDSIAILDLNVRYNHPNDKLTVNLWGRNLGDRVYYNNKFAVSTGHTIQGALAEPRSFGVTLGYKF